MAIKVGDLVRVVDIGSGFIPEMRANFWKVKRVTCVSDTSVYLDNRYEYCKSSVCKVRNKYTTYEREQRRQCKLKEGDKVMVRYVKPKYGYDSYYRVSGDVVVVKYILPTGVILVSGDRVPFYACKLQA